MSEFVLPGLVPTHRDDQLVVDLQHLELVQRMLGELKIRYTGPVCDELLGLARLGDLAVQVSPQDEREPIESVDGLLLLLRQRAAAERDGWVPTMGKNRFLEAVIGDGVALESHKPMSGGEPVDVDPAEQLPRAVAALGAGVRIGLIDTEAPVPDADGALPYRTGHGIFVRDLIERQAPSARVVPNPVVPGDGRADSWRVAQAIVQLGTGPTPVDIINLSLGTYTLAGGPPLVVTRAVERVADKVVVVAAAGNHATSRGSSTAAARVRPAGRPPSPRSSRSVRSIATATERPGARPWTGSAVLPSASTSSRSTSRARSGWPTDRQRSSTVRHAGAGPRSLPQR